MVNRKFRKVYLIVDNKKVFSDHNYEVVNLYRRKEYAVKVCEANNKQRVAEHNYQHNQNQPLVLGKVHGYFLVHESFFEGED